MPERSQPVQAAEPSDPEGESSAASEAAAKQTPASEEADRKALERRKQDLRDRKLVRRLVAGDERAFQELVALYQDRIFGLVYRMIGNRQEAEDIAQEVFLIVYRRIDTYRGEGRFYTWLYRVASNTCKNRIKYLKGRNFHRSSDLDDTPGAHLAGKDGGPVVTLQSQVPGPEQQYEGLRLEEIVSRELENLDPEHRLLIVLRDVQGMTYSDIMRVTGLQEGTLKSRLHRARVALKARVAPYMK